MGGGRLVATFTDPEATSSGCSRTVDDGDDGDAAAPVA
jgi:hypothetical protein